MTEQRPLNTAHLPVRLRLEDYLLLDQSGAFSDYERTELIEGEILFMNAQHRPHAFLKAELAYRLRVALEGSGSDLYVLTEGTVAIPPDSAPEPDIVLTREPRGDGPVPLASVGLVVEVADTTLDFDLTRKAGLYARAGIAEYWVADVAERSIRRFWSPDEESYREQRQSALGELVASATISGLTVSTKGI